MAFDSEIERFEDVKRRLNKVSDRKIRVEEHLKREKSSLKDLVAEIESKGYDPKNLAEVRDKKREEIDRLLKELEAGVEEAEKKLQSIEV